MNMESAKVDSLLKNWSFLFNIEHILHDAYFCYTLERICLNHHYFLV